ncbi:MAG: hypothetical protein QOD84_3131 [Acidobacteriaceae bacterium]|jgi:hypothetical protein
MEGKKLIRQEEVGINKGQRTGMMLMTIGKIMLGMDLLLLAFVYVGVKGGSNLWVWMVMGDGIVAIALIAVGASKRGSLSRGPGGPGTPAV